MDLSCVRAVSWRMRICRLASGSPSPQASRVASRVSAGVSPYSSRSTVSSRTEGAPASCTTTSAAGCRQRGGQDVGGWEGQNQHLGRGAGLVGGARGLGGLRLVGMAGGLDHLGKAAREAPVAGLAGGVEPARPALAGRIGQQQVALGCVDGHGEGEPLQQPRGDRRQRGQPSGAFAQGDGAAHMRHHLSRARGCLRPRRRPGSARAASRNTLRSGAAVPPGRPRRNAGRNG